MHAPFGDLSSTSQHHQVDANAFTNVPVLVAGISKNGDRELRTAFIHGARALLRWAPQRSDPLSRWVMRVKQQHGHNKVAVALANKLARIAWVVAAHERDYDPRLTNA